MKMLQRQDLTEEERAAAQVREPSTDKVKRVRS